MLRTHVEFRSRAFPAEPGEDEQINPGRHGKRLAEYLRSELPKHGFPVRSVGVEDWGWMVELQHEPFPLWIGCGNQDDTEDGFLCFIEPSKPTVRKWLKTHDARPVIERLATALERVLLAHPETRELQWAETGARD